MNPPKYTAIDYINFLIATQKGYSCTEAAKIKPEMTSQPAYDAINRLYTVSNSVQKTYEEKHKPG